MLVVMAFVGSLTVACGSSSPVGARAPVTSPRPEQVIEVSPVVISPLTDAELVAEFERGRGLLLDGKASEAAAIFDKLTRLAPDCEVTPPSLYNAAFAYEALGERETSAERHRELLRRFPGHALERSALFRLGRVLAYLERWSELVAVADRALAREDLAPLEIVEARGVRALGLVEQDRVDEAAREVGKARDVAEAHRIGEAGKPPLELAVVWFALGEVRRKRSEAIEFVPMPDDFAETLERRCQGLLDAQGAYTEAMRSLDARWSAMAGYRVGGLYQELHHDVMKVPTPKEALTLRQKQLFEGAMRLRYRVLLEKGLAMMDGTTRLGDRTGEDSAWVARAREAKRALELALDDEKAALERLPFTEAELREALEELKKRKKRP
jgi:tetratricopeptide (TPR) repeat protein